MVDAEHRPPRRIFIGPSFRNIANTPGRTATALRVFLTTSHLKVPNPIVTSEQMADVIAYIVSLRSDRDPGPEDQWGSSALDRMCRVWDSSISACVAAFAYRRHQ